jgi:pimeloyl-ACP methyl ester carboxylesterase
MRRHTITVAGIETPVVEAGPDGASEAVVFVHGNPGSGEDWTDLVDAIGAAGLRAVAPTMPGFGGVLAPHDWPATIEAYSAQLEAVRLALGIDRAHLVLHDFGGPWGTDWLLHHPGAHASTVMINSGTLLPRWHLLAHVWRAPKLGELFMKTTTRSGFRQLIKFTDPGLPRDFVDRAYESLTPATRDVILRLYRQTDIAAAAEAWSVALANVQRPALVIHGDRDRYIGMSVAEHQAKVLGAGPVQVIKGGHWAFREQPERTATLLVDFLTPLARATA